MAHKQSIIEAIAQLGDITVEEAGRVLAVFVKVRAVTVSARDGFQVTWGGYMDRDVIRRALEQAAR